MRWRRWKMCAMDDKDDLREFMIVLRRALLMVVDWIEKRYGLKRKA